MVGVNDATRRKSGGRGSPLLLLHEWVARLNAQRVGAADSEGSKRFVSSCSSLTNSVFKMVGTRYVDYVFSTLCDSFRNIGGPSTQ
jgi:hypothetical protein